jgi:hypothetical protein
LAIIRLVFFIDCPLADRFRNEGAAEASNYSKSFIDDSQINCLSIIWHSKSTHASASSNLSLTLKQKAF